MNIVVCGALFRPLQWELEDDSDDESESSSSESESDSESSETDSEDPTLKKNSQHSIKMPELTPNPIQFTESNLVNSTSTRMLKQINSRPRLMKGFSSDTCLNYQENNSFPHLQTSLGTKNKIEDSSQNFNEFENTLNLFTNYKPLEKHKSLHVLSTVEPFDNDVNFSKSAGSLNLYKSFLDFARTSKSTEECDYDREELEKAGFLVVDADELVNCESQWNSQNGIFFPFITSEENFKDKIKSTRSIHKNTLEVAQLNKMQDFNNNEPQTEEVKFTEIGASNNSNFLGNSASKNIFARFSEFFSGIRAQKNSSSITYNKPSQLKPSTTSPAAPTKPGKTKNQQLFIKTVRTAQNGQRFIIARCNCQQTRPTSKRSMVNVEHETSQSPLPKFSSQTNLEIPDAVIKKSKSPKPWRHAHDCPVTYLNRLKNVHSKKPSVNNPNHNHSNLPKRQNSLSYVPSLFQNSYRFPLHFKNVYYYKSLINLNMRLMHLKNHGSNQARKEPAGVLNLDSKKINNLNNLSLSCPDLNLNQVLVINTSDKKLIPLNAVDKPLQNQLLQQNLIAAGSMKGSKILNGGSIFLNKPTSENKSRRSSNSTKSKKQTLEEKTLENTIKNSKLNQMDPNDLEELDLVKKKANKNTNESSSSSSSDESSSDESSDDECDLFLKKHRMGRYFYKFIWRPTVRPLKYIFYSIAESLKLFYLFNFCVFALCNFILSFFYEAPFYFINTYMIENGSTHNEAGTVTVAVGIVCIFASSNKIINSI